MIYVSINTLKLYGYNAMALQVSFRRTMHLFFLSLKNRYLQSSIAIFFFYVLYASLKASKEPNDKPNDILWEKKKRVLNLTCPLRTDVSFNFCRSNSNLILLSVTVCRSSEIVTHAFQTFLWCIKRKIRNILD